MTTTTKATRAQIQLGNIDLDVFQLPNGDYQISQSQVCSSVGKPAKRMVELAGSDKGQILIQSGFEKGLKVSVEGSKPVNLVPLDVAFQFWALELSIGNMEALALVIACGVEALERRADAAFSIVRTEQERNDRFIVRKDSILQRHFWTNTIKEYIDNHPEMSTSDKQFMYANVSDILNLGLFGMSAKEIRVILDMDKNELVRDCIHPSLLRDVEFVEKYAAVSVRNGSEPVQAVKMALAFFNASIKCPKTGEVIV